MDVKNPSSKTFHAIKNDLLMTRKTHGHPVIDLRRFTRYVVGKTSADGIHYNRQSGEAWAKPLNAALIKFSQRTLRRAAKSPAIISRRRDRKLQLSPWH